MGTHADVARFHPDDCDELVVASLVCELCLHSDAVEWTLCSDSYDATAHCHCPHCDYRWSVYLSAQQALRLSLLGARAH